MADIDIEQLKSQLEQTKRSLDAAQQKKLLLEGQLQQLKMQREEIINQLRELGVNNPTDFDKTMTDLSLEIQQTLEKIQELTSQLPEDVQRELKQHF